MAMINYADKVALNQNSNIADINKCNASDLNEIKKAFNNQVAFGWYQTGLSPTFTYVSWDCSVYTGVVNSNLDLTPYLSVGMKIKFTQNSTIKYAFITAITSTQLTLFLGTDYSLNNSAISNSYYSMLKAPFGFPLNPDKWSVTKTSNVRTLLTTVVVGTVYNLASLKISVPIGLFNFIATGCCFITHTANNSADFIISLSTSATSISNSGNNVFIASLVSSGAVASININKLITNTAKVDYYLVETVTYATTTVSSLDLRGENQTVILKAVCDYL